MTTEQRNAIEFALKELRPNKFIKKIKVGLSSLASEKFELTCYYVTDGSMKKEEINMDSFKTLSKQLAYKIQRKLNIRIENVKTIVQ